MIRVITCVLLFATITMFPWRIYNKIDTGSLRWVQTMDITVRNSFSTPEALLKIGGAFVIDGGGDLSCRLEPSYCGRNADTWLFVKVFATHFVDWETIKARLIPLYWFSTPTLLGATIAPPTLSDWVWGLVFAIILCSIFPSLLLLDGINLLQL